MMNSSGDGDVKCMTAGVTCDLGLYRVLVLGSNDPRNPDFDFIECISLSRATGKNKTFHQAILTIILDDIKARYDSI